MLNLTQFRAALDPALLSDFEAILAVKNVSINAALASQEQAVATAKIEIQTNLDGLLQAGQAARAAEDWSAMDVVLAAAYGYTAAARRAKLEFDLAAAQVAVAEATANLATL